MGAVNRHHAAYLALERFAEHGVTVAQAIAVLEAPTTEADVALAQAAYLHLPEWEAVKRDLAKILRALAAGRPLKGSRR